MEPADLPAVKQAALLTDGFLSARELLESCRQRAEATEPVVNALVATDWDRAADRALALDDDRSLCADGSLRGLVTAHKDLLDTAGVVTTYGSVVFADHVPDVDHPLVSALRVAGVVAVGKTNTPEFGAGSHTFNPVYGVTRNPWDPSRSAGGSSGGAASALACGSLSVADGSDLGGSLRNPASFCGIVGFRPSAGWISHRVASDPRISMPTTGPMGRCVADVAMLLDAMTDGTALPGAPEDGPDSSTHRPRIGLSLDHGDLPVDPEVRSVVEAAAHRLEAAGWRVDAATLPLAGADRCFATLRSFSYSLMHPGLVDDARVKSTVRREIASGLALTDDEVAAALAEEQRLRREWSRLFSSVDIALTPTSQVPPFPVGDEWVTRIDGDDLDTYTEWMRSCSRLTVPGGPSLSLPAGFTDDGLPVGIQLSAARGADLRLLGFARIAEEVLGVWPRPPIDALASMEPATLPPGPGD